ncbi:MAG: sodium/proline symporter [Oscillospiraceae bacterium]|nr:sodium/proline symporter [Oscillospiraceae bacterium]
MTSNLIIMLITIIAYMVMMVVIGIVCSKKNENVGDFYLGGRKLGPIVTAMSAEASDMSSWLLMGLPGVAYLTGCAEAGWTAIGLAIGTYVNWLIVAKRLRVYTQKCGNAITIPDFFANRYRDKKNILMGIAAIIILVFFVPYTASGFAACGKLFSTLFGIDYHIAMIVSAIIIVVYTSIGGFLAASTTDLIQSIVMTLALIILVFFGVSAAGGMGNVMDNAEGLKDYLSFTALHNPEGGESTTYGALPIASTLAWGLGYFGMPHILLRFMAIEDKNKVKVSRRIASIWVVISMGVAIFIGMIGNTLSAQGTIGKLVGSSEAETVVMKMATFMSEYGVLAAIAAGLIFAGILACTMSTSDSQLLAASSSMSENLLKGMFKVKMNDKQSMLCARLVLIVISVLSVFIAWNPDSSVFRIVSFAWAGFGATFAPVMLLALFWKRSNKWGALAGMVTGGVMVFVWKFVLAPMGGLWSIYELLPAFVLAMIVNVAVSLLVKQDKGEMDDMAAEYDAVCAELKN